MNAKAETKKAVPAIDAAVTVNENANPMHAGTINLTFSNGKSLVLEAARLPESIIRQAVMHGLKQKLVDAAAIARDTETGKAATIDTKYAAVKDVFDRLLAGEWNKRREGGPTGGLLKRALIAMYEGRKTAEQIQAYLDGKSDKDKAALRKNPKVAEIIERLRKEDAEASGEDAGVDLLAELEADEEPPVESDGKEPADQDVGA